MLQSSVNQAITIKCTLGTVTFDFDARKINYNRPNNILSQSMHLSSMFINMDDITKINIKEKNGFIIKEPPTITFEIKGKTLYAFEEASVDATLMVPKTMKIYKEQVAPILTRLQKEIEDR